MSSWGSWEKQSKTDKQLSVLLLVNQEKIKTSLRKFGLFIDSLPSSKAITWNTNDNLTCFKQNDEAISNHEKFLIACHWQ
ncbi:hypothetical protein MSUIS_01210 [Mycoplasma suis KI3806]|uniref:Uncharacterized protein n=1 Tax=Mycoplasma suis (strain KI_3806) TaxID=708248 RepID=F0V2Z2_MYCS3|nr:hypothetical protein [Mycoplasma suis]CBZ40214.1 hypothetical protein MSUIS_01210 [Mycoplasma suis KI3806]